VAERLLVAGSPVEDDLDVEPVDPKVPPASTALRFARMVRTRVSARVP
jgi:hypothetical protein